MNTMGFKQKAVRDRETYEGEALGFVDCLEENLLNMETKEGTELLIKLHSIIYGDRITECFEEGLL